MSEDGCWNTVVRVSSRMINCSLYMFVDACVRRPTLARTFCA